MVRFHLPIAIVAIPVALALSVACGAVAPSNPANPAPAATSAPPPAPSSSAKPATDIVPASFFLEVTAPQNEAVVTVSPLPVQGQTTPDSVTTVNGLVVEVDAQGQFLAQVNLEEGPNFIEVLASDFDGHQEGQILTVIYIP
ncbi:MAG TPA: hypothetical protein VI855_00495 [Dehalococcoidia bacterium]|nr:hypothetical protein [Dehalococcoidia bacterium]